MHEPQILQLIPPAVSLLSDMVDVGVSVVALHKMPAELADALVAGDDGQPGTLPRRRAVAPLGRRGTLYERPGPGPKCRDSLGHSSTTRP